LEECHLPKAVPENLIPVSVKNFFWYASAHSLGAKIRYDCVYENRFGLFEPKSPHIEHPVRNKPIFKVKFPQYLK
jgi:hypothetical protein